MMNEQFKPRKHIVDIRRKKFGLRTRGKFIENPLAQEYHRAIGHLSEGLNSENIHFVFELIQNAEDNVYSCNTEPDVKIFFLEEDPTLTPGSKGALLFVNNELGFQPQHVEALCAIGISTKDRSEYQGYIGEKGIGFKSVFKVTERPYIFSNGYRFYFDSRPHPEARIGYVIPNWVARLPAPVRRYPRQTCILLPLKENQATDVGNRLRDISPECILFLSKIKKLTIKPQNQPAVTIHRTDYGLHEIHLTVNGNPSKYWWGQAIARTEGVAATGREMISSRPVQVAFPLYRRGIYSNVFAYLPTAIYSGLPFLVNTDFILNTSREMVQVDNEWNQNLRSYIPLAFLDAFKTILDHPKLKLSAYQYIPLNDPSLPPFFVPVTQAILNQLRTENIFWTENGQKLPASSVRTGNDALRTLLRDKDLPIFLMENPLVHPIIQKNYSTQLTALGIRPIDLDDFTRCLQDSAWLARKPKTWILELYRYLSMQDIKDPVVLRQVEIVPLKGNGFVSTNTSTVYFPDPEVRDLLKKYGRVLKNWQLNFLDDQVYAGLRKENVLLDWAQKMLGIQKLNLDTLCVEIARRLNNHATNMSPQTVVEITRFLRNQWKSLNDDSHREIQEWLPFLLEDGSLYIPGQTDGQMVMPKNFDPTSGWQLVFVDKEDREGFAILSSDYLGKGSLITERKAWRAFFGALGIREFPVPVRWLWHWVYSSKPSNLPSKSLTDLPRSSQGYDFYSALPPMWLDAIKNKPEIGIQYRQNATALLRWLEWHHEHETTDFLEARLDYFYYSSGTKWMPSIFLENLRDTPWLPTTRGMVQPGDAFLDTPEFRDLFGNKVPYVGKNSNRELVSSLGIRQSATRQEIMVVLERQAGKPAKQARPELIKKIYQFLASRWSDELRTTFRQSPLILVHKATPRWINAQQAIWPDLSAVFGDQFVYLSREYRDLTDFFVNKVGVDREVTDEVYATAWIQLTQMRKPQAEQVKSALQKIYPVLLNVASSPQLPLWWQDFEANCKVWTQSNRFAKPGEVFIPDDGELRRQLEKIVQFAWRPDGKSFSDYMPLFRCLGVRSLVECVQINATRNDGVPGSQNVLLTDGAKIGIVYYLRNQLQPEYERLKNSGLLDQMLRTSEATVDPLRVTYTIDGNSLSTSEGVAFWDTTGEFLYLNTARQADWDIETPAAIARRMVAPNKARDLENFLGRLLGANLEKVERLLAKHNMSISRDEKDWVKKYMNRFASPEEPAIEPPLEESEMQPERSDEDETRTNLPDEREYWGDDGEGRKEIGKDRQPHPINYPPTGRPSERGRSYLEPDPETKANGREKLIQIDDEIEDDPGAAGIRRVMEYEMRMGRQPTYLGDTHKGWDIDSINPKGEGVDAILGRPETRHIEVKAKAGEWDGWGVALKPAQLEAAKEHGKSYYLYVVEHALDESNQNPPLIFPNPYKMIMEFRLDDGWKVFSKNETELDI